MIKLLANLFGPGLLDRVLDTVDHKIKSDVDKDKIKADIIKVHLETRPDFMRAGGLWLMLMFALPLAFWHGAVAVYSVFWCAGCAYPQDWTIAALPSPLDEWAGLMIISIFSVVGADRLLRR